MKKTITIGALALLCALVSGQVAAQACDGKGPRGPQPTTPAPTPEPGYSGN